NERAPAGGITERGAGGDEPRYPVRVPLGPSRLAGTARCGARWCPEGRSIVEEVLELLGSAGVAQLAQGLGLDLADPLPRHPELLAHLLQGPPPPVLQPEPHPEDLPLPHAPGPQAVLHLLPQLLPARRLRRRRRLVVLDEVAEIAVLLLPDRHLQGDRVLADLQALPPPLRRQLHRQRDLLARRLPPQLLLQPPAGPDQAVDGLDHVDRDADGAGLVGDGPGDRLADPPGGVGAELEALVVLELLDRPDQAALALPDPIATAQAAAGA